MTNGAFLTSELPVVQNVAPTDRILVLYNASGVTGTPTTMMIPVTNFVNATISTVLADIASTNSFTLGNSTVNTFATSTSFALQNLSGVVFAVDANGVITGNGFNITSVNGATINGLSTVARSGLYNDLANTPAFAQSAFIDTSNASNINTGTFGTGVSFSSLNVNGPFTFYSNTYTNVPGSPAVGATMVITDANVTSGNVTVGGGTNAVLAWYNGTNWRCLVD